MISDNKKRQLSIFVPVKNELTNISVMIRILEAALEVPHEVIIVYDSPKDSTIPVVRILQKKYKNIKLVHNRLGPGITNALKAGINASNGEYILIFASDDVGPVLAIEDMVYLMKRGCDLVSCTRYAHGGRRLGGSKIQAVLSKTGNYFFRLLVGTALTDSTTGIKMFRRDISKKISFESRVGWAVVFELAVKAQAEGLKLGEVPIISIDRLYGGKSSFKLSPWIKEYFRWFLFGIKNFKKLRKNNKVKVRIPKATAL